MGSTTPPPSSDISPSPSIYSYQTRLSNKTSSNSLAGLAGSSKDAASGRPVSRINSFREDSTVGGLRRSGSGARIGLSGGSMRGTSIDNVRGQWEAKIEAAATEKDQPPPPTLRRPRSALLSSTALAASQLRPASPSRGTASTAPDSILDDSSLSSRASERSRKRATVAEVAGWEAPKMEDRAPVVSQAAYNKDTSSIPANESPALSTSAIKDSIPQSSAAADTLAQARANALRRLEAKKAAGVVIEEPTIDLPPMPTIPSPPKRTTPVSRPASSSRQQLPLAEPTEDSRFEATPVKTVRKTQSTQSLAAKFEVRDKEEPVEIVSLRSRLKSVTKDARNGVSGSPSESSPQPENLQHIKTDVLRSRPPSIVDRLPPATPSAVEKTDKPVVPASGASVLHRVKSFDAGAAPVIRKVKSFDTGAREPPKFLHKAVDSVPSGTASKPSASPKVLSTAPAADSETPAAPPKESDKSSPNKASKFAGLSYRAPTGPPKGTVSSLANKWSAGDSSGAGVGLVAAPRERVPSLSSDRRRLGKHLPRIVSGDQGWDGDGRRASQPRIVSVRNRKSSLGRAALSTPTEENTPPRESQQPERSVPSTPTVKRPLAPSAATNQPSIASSPKSLSTLRKQSSKNNGLNLVTPRAQVTGAEMKGLMSAVGAASARNDPETGEGVAGMSNRLRLSSRLPLAASSAKMAPAPLPSKRLAANNNWMDRQRHDLASYEYLCHVGEAQQWIEGCLDEELEFGVTEMDDGLKDGVALAKLARVFQGEDVVKHIWTEAKHRFRQSDNINYFLNFVRTVGMPETFIFELTDLYNQKNIPKVIFCIHVLSHLLARLGRAERMNNLVGQFEFTDEQLKATEKGIKGIAMPNFQQVGQSLAKEASWEAPIQEEEEETEDERRDRELLECESSISALQHHLRGVLARQRMSRVKAQLKLVTPIVTRIQSQSRGHMSRMSAKTEKRTHRQLGSWAVSLQTAARAHLSTRQYKSHVTGVRGSERPIIGVQAHARGMLARMRYDNKQNHLDRSRKAFIGVQAYARGRMARAAYKRDRSAIYHPSTAKSITGVQAVLRGKLVRQKAANEQRVVQAHTSTFVSVQSHLRGALVRRRQRAREERMDNAADYIVAIQAVARGVLARKRKQVFSRDAVQVKSSVSSFQALARARLAKKTHENMQKQLAKVEVAGSIGGLQAFLRSKLAKHKTVEQKKKLEFVQPDVVGFQAMARGALARREFNEWREYLVDPHTQGALVFLQSLVRGFIARRKYWMRKAYLHHNQAKIVKVQALWRGRQQRRMYDRLITGSGVDVPTIQNYMHLLDDTENDFRDQLHIDTLRKDVIELLRTNQILETEVGELDTKIALILKNKMSFEDLVRAKRRHGAQPEESFQTPGGGDPFVGVHLDRTSQRKLELFEHLFFTLQTEPQYLSRLLHKATLDPEMEKDCRLVEAVTLILFGFGHDKREEYLFHKLCQISVHEQVLRSRSLPELANTRFAIISVVMQFIRPHLAPYLKAVLTEHIQRVVQVDELDLSTDPVDIYNRILNAEESLTGMKSLLSRDLDADQILQSHAETRTLYIQHLQELRSLTDLLTKAILDATPLMPYTVRLLAREALLALRVRYQDHDDSELWPVVAKSVILPFILPGIVAPETYDIANSVDPVQRRNLANIGNLFGHVAAQDYSKPERLVQLPLQEYIRAAGRDMGSWIFDVAEVEFDVHEMLGATTEATPISITRSDVYGLLGILMRNIPTLTAGRSGDAIEDVLNELEGPPLDYDRSNKTVRVRLTNRLAQLQPSDPTVARERELEVQAKRHVIAVLRVQTGKDLFDVLLQHPTEEDEQRWIYEVHRDIALEQARLARHDLPPTPTEAEYQMESIRSLPFHEVKARAVEFCMALVELGRLSREDHLEGLLVSIASDIREKHRLRQQRRVNMKSMSEAKAASSEKRQNFEEQIQSYHDYIDSAMAALQQKKKAPFMSKQFWHQRGKGKKSKFGSYKYTAADLYERGILLSVNQFSPRQFDKLHLVISSDKVGVFSLEMTHPASGQDSGLIGHEELRMEDLLQAQFDNNVRLDLFDGMALFNLNTLIHQINKKFYAS